MSAPAVAVRERPILFSAPMVRALLDGTKTQTRRVAMHTVCGVRLARLAFDSAPEPSSCPYGQPGDRLWVRETFHPIPGNSGAVCYRASCENGAEKNYKFKPSIFMPRWASRITLEIAGVRVERVQSISPTDAQAEGIGYSSTALVTSEPWTPAALVERYAMLWDSLNAARGYGWDVNPWVWVLEFRAVTP